MAGILNIRQVPFTNADMAAFKQAETGLCSYDPPFVQDALAEIPKILDLPDMKAVTEHGKDLQVMYRDARKAGNMALAQQFAVLPSFNSTDYIRQTIMFRDIHTAALKFIGAENLKGKRALQIASNWAPYLHFLKNEHGMNVFGIDSNLAAVKYARQSGGLNVVRGDAGAMGFLDDYFDVTLSYNFLVEGYLSLFHRDPNLFMQQIVREVHRTLKPGGFFISQDEELHNFVPGMGLFSDYFTFKTPSGLPPVSILIK